MTPTLDYTVKSKRSDVVWLFKFDLNDNLKAFEILGGKLTDDQVKWLFTPENFPYNKSIIDSKWKDLKKNFEITKGELDLSFESFYKIYDNKLGKKEGRTAWKKLSKKDKIDAIMGIKHYNNYLKRNMWLSKAYPPSYLNKRFWENDYKSTA